jgi:hypothetical protein
MWVIGGALTAAENHSPEKWQSCGQESFACRVAPPTRYVVVLRNKIHSSSGEDEQHETPNKTNFM